MIHTPHVVEVVANFSIQSDPIYPPNKRHKNNPPKAPSNIPKHILKNASSSSVGLGIDMSSAIVLHAADEKKLSTVNLVSCGEQVMAFAFQVFFMLPFCKLHTYSMFLIMYPTNAGYALVTRASGIVQG